MPDITKCPGEGCSVREKCYRFTATANQDYQSWMATPSPSGEECEYFWKIAAFRTQEGQDVRGNHRG